MAAQSKSFPPRFRLQGTDGIRREVRLHSHPSVKNKTPLQAFLEEGVITDRFMEQYAFAHVSSLIEAGHLHPGDSFVVGWDPRDVQGAFTESVVRGIRKAGVHARVLGVVPTPLVPMMMLATGAGGAFMITASHNPKDQNGIKTFLAWRGMKLLPQNDITLTRALLALKSIRTLPLKGKRIDQRAEALDLFREFSLGEINSWCHDIGFEDIVLVVDPARGSLTGIAAEVFRLAGFGQVIEVNNRLNGDVNLKSGVADLEGQTAIGRDMIRKGSGLFARHTAIRKLFELAEKHKARIRKGTLRLSGAVFDADGDRFYRLEYDPKHDHLIVLSGDETAILQAQFLMKREPDTCRGAAYINTVESDLNTSRAAEKLGFKPQLAPVGDKWILLRIALLILETRIHTVKSPKRAALKKELARLKKSQALDISALEALEKKVDRTHPGLTDFRRLPFAVGSEETGHNITLGWMDGDGEEAIPVFFGNGLKSALNTYAATQFLVGGKRVDQYYARLRRPFPPGFKGTRYAYYIHQERFHNGSPVWRRVRQCIQKNARARGYWVKAVPFPEDPDMLYLALEKQNGGRAGVFVRNSGTENKISVNLRGAKSDASALKAIGEEAVRILFTALKNTGHHLYKIELDLLSQIAAKPLPDSRVTDATEQRVLMEMAKQKLIHPSGQGWRLTALGSWYIKSTPE